MYIILNLLLEQDFIYFKLLLQCVKKFDWI